MESTTNFKVQKPQKNPKARLGPSEKLCTYFKEGKCHRADCKFAHDMARITCRFWEKAECFKGPTCPFLHGYMDCQPVWSQSESVELVPEFSDNDFPELNKAKQEERNIRNGKGSDKKRNRKSPLRRSQPIDIKRNRPK